MTLSRSEVEQYVKYAERLSGDLEVCLSDLRFRENGGKLHLAVDFSEIHSFLLPDKLPDDWLWPGLTEEMKGVVEHSALSEVLTGPPKPVLLPPYFLEFQNFLANQRATAQMRLIEDGGRAFDELDALMETTDAQAMMALAVRIDRELYRPSETELRTAVTFFEARASHLVSIVRGEVLYPLERAKALLDTSPFGSLDSITPVRLTGQEKDVSTRFKRLQKMRGGERDGATFMDALALEYVRRANHELLRRKEPARVLLVSRSPVLGRLVAEEMRDGLWPNIEHGVLRHPRAFAPLAWNATRARETAVPQLEATHASINLCRRSAGLRLTGSWTALEERRADRGLAEQINGLKMHILNLAQMGGSINESRIVIRKDAPTEHEVLRLLAMLRNRDDVLNAVADRMAAINIQVDRAHELVGVLLHIEQAIGGEIAVQRPSQGVRAIIPRMGRLPYALRFKTARLLGLLDELRHKGQKGDITQDDVRALAVRATEETADHYETLLFMAYVLGLLGQYELADRYCRRALQSADRHGRADQQEALFFQALCTRVLATEPAAYQRALSVLDALCRLTRDARYLAEQGNIRLRWCQRAAKDPAWRPSAPSVFEAVAWLEQAAAETGDDRRLLASVQNSLCYAWATAYEQTPSEDVKARGNAALAVLMETLYAIDDDPNHWPLRIKDTIVSGFLTFERSEYDVDFLKRLVKGIRFDLESDTYIGDRAELRSRVHQYEAQLAKLRGHAG